MGYTLTGKLKGSGRGYDKKEKRKADSWIHHSTQPEAKKF